MNILAPTYSKLLLLRNKPKTSAKSPEIRVQQSITPRKCGREGRQNVKAVRRENLQRLSLLLTVGCTGTSDRSKSNTIF